MGKKVLVVGQGAREHALVWKIAQSSAVDKIFAAPGNAGIAELADCVDVGAEDVEGLARLVEAKGIDLTVVGPEAPLVGGIVDEFYKRGLKIFGPAAQAARLEGSKVFAKELMRKYGIPTARFAIFDNPQEAKEYVRQVGVPVVIKADGLAAGKGVTVAFEWEEAVLAVERIMEKREFGAAGRQIVVEECLEGEEVSVFAFSDGQKTLHMTAAQDHKRVFDGDQGPNTGGMGAYSPPPIYTEELKNRVMKEIVNPVIEAMAKEGCSYRGVLYAGLMITKEGPKVLEFNARLGDPEAQAILPLMTSDILPVLEGVAGGDLGACRAEFSNEACVCVVLASGGYPGKFSKGHVITGLNNVSSEILVFHAGTKRLGAEVVTDGGRVLSMVACGSTIEEAVQKVYEEIQKVNFHGMHYRRDIAYRALRRR